jgi:hypothetical protein
VSGGGASFKVTVVDSEASNNFAIGVGATSAKTAVMVRNSVASYNGIVGLDAEVSAIIRVAHSVVTGNNTGLLAPNGGTLDSYGDNDIDGNTTNGSPTATIPTH